MNRQFLNVFLISVTLMPFCIFYRLEIGDRLLLILELLSYVAFSLVGLLAIKNDFESGLIKKTCIVDFKQINSVVTLFFLVLILIGLLIKDDIVFLIVYICMFCFLYIAQLNYYNPVYFLMYSFYSCRLTNGNNVIIILKKKIKVIEDIPDEAEFKELSSFVFIEK